MTLKKIPSIWLPILFALCFQLQLQIPFNGTVLNIAPADILLVGLLFYVFFFAKGMLFEIPSSINRPLLGLFFCFLLLLTISFLKGTQDSWSLKKYIGFYVLFAYWLVGLFLNRQNFNTTLFAKAFIIVFSVTSAFYMLFTSLWFFKYNTLCSCPLRGNIVEGFVNNPNIFGFLGCVSLIFHLAYKRIFPKKSLDFLVLSIETIFIYKSGSRAAWLCGFFILIYFFFYGKEYYKNLIYIIAVLGAYVSIGNIIKMTNHPQSKNLIITTQLVLSPKALVKEDLSYSFRIVSTKEALDLIREKPLFGHSLGYALAHTTKEFTHQYIIHNTALWIASEMGLITLMIVAGIFMILLRHCKTKEKESGDPFFHALFVIFLMTALFSCFHEILFQRILWFLMGFCTLLTKPTPKM